MCAEQAGVLAGTSSPTIGSAVEVQPVGGAWFDLLVTPGGLGDANGSGSPGLGLAVHIQRGILPSPALF